MLGPSGKSVLALPAFDIFQQLHPRDTSDDAPVVIVDIDEPSLKQLGQWPWPRTVIARILDKLGEAMLGLHPRRMARTHPQEAATLKSSQRNRDDTLHFHRR